MQKQKQKQTQKKVESATIRVSVDLKNQLTKIRNSGHFDSYDSALKWLIGNRGV